MAYGTANVDTIQSSTAGTPTQFKDGNGTQVGTLCRAWVNFNGTTSPGTIRAQLNVSSVTKNGTGDYTLNFTNALPDTNYAITSWVRRENDNVLPTACNAGSSWTKTTTALRIFVVYANGASSFTTDNPEIGIAIFR